MFLDECSTDRKKLYQVSTIVIHSCSFCSSSSHFSFYFFTSDLFTNLPLSDELIGYKIRANHELSSTLDFSQDVVWTFYKLLRVFYQTRSCSVFATFNEALLWYAPVMYRHDPHEGHDIWKEPRFSWLDKTHKFAFD